MSNPKQYKGPETGRLYDFAAGDRIDAVAEGIGYTGDKSSPSAVVAGREVYKRVFVRLKTPVETLTCTPINNAEDFARRVAIIEHWFNSCVRYRNIVLTFEAMEVTDKEAQAMEQQSIR